MLPEDRAILYAIAMRTGFRASELRSLTPEDFDLAATPPTITCAFHSLRHTFVSLLVRSGASIEAVQTLAGHANPSMTLGAYAHVRIFDLEQGLEGLKGLSHVLPTACVPLGLTGTDATPVDHSETPGKQSQSRSLLPGEGLSTSAASCLLSLNGGGLASLPSARVSRHHVARADLSSHPSTALWSPRQFTPLPGPRLAPGRSSRTWSMPWTSEHLRTSVGFFLSAWLIAGFAFSGMIDCSPSRFLNRV